MIMSMDSQMCNCTSQLALRAPRNNELTRLPILRRQFKCRKIKSGRHGAADQRPVAGAFGGLPGMRRHDRLRLFAGGEVRPEPEAPLSIVIRDLQRQRGACVIVPDLDVIDAMPVRTLAACQQEIDRGGPRAAVCVGTGIAKRLAIIAAFRMRLQFEPRDDLGSACLGRICRQRHQDLFLRSRNSPNTSAALAPFMWSFAATDGSSARRNTLAFFSSPSSVGTVGLFSLRNRVTSAARAVSAALSGSTVSANLTLAAVYSWPQ